MDELTHTEAKTLHTELRGVMETLKESSDQTVRLLSAAMAAMMAKQSREEKLEQLEKLKDAVKQL